MLNFRSLNNLNNTIIDGLHKIPKDIGIIIGIPRSGLLVANMIALYLNLPLTDLEGFAEKRLLKCGDRLNLTQTDLKFIFDKKALVVDDSVFTGSAMQKAKNTIAKTNMRGEIIYCSIYVTPESKSLVDLYFEEIRGYRIFEWNLFHSEILGQSCVDIDGVLCKDPTDAENDDGERYESFLANAIPLILPSAEIGYLTTCRLEKYRQLTEQWLGKHDVRFRKLFMLDLPDKQTRLAKGIHANFKADIYKSTKAKFFIESNQIQARKISKLANKPVLCFETREIFYPSSADYIINKIVNDPYSIGRRINMLHNWFRRILFDVDPPKERAN